MNTLFFEQLEILNKEMLLMGQLCEKVITLSAKRLETRDKEIQNQVHDISIQMNRKEREVESLCMRLLLHQQLIEKELTVVTSALKIVTEMERIGGKCFDLTEINGLDNINMQDEMIYVRQMAEDIIKMLTKAIDSFINKDEILARIVIEYDHVVDDNFNKIKTGLVSKLRESDSKGESDLDLLMIAKYFERIGDQVVNIAHWVIFSITGNREIE